MKIYVEYESGDRTASRFKPADFAPIAEQAEPLLVRFVAWDVKLGRWMYANDLTGRWYWFDGVHLREEK